MGIVAIRTLWLASGRLLISGFFLLCLIKAEPVRAQDAPDLSKYPTVEEKLKAWGDYCDLFIGKKGYPQNYPKLIIEAHKGLSNCPPGQPKYKALFCYYLGVSFEFSDDNDSAVIFLQQAEQYARSAADVKRLVLSLNQLIHCYYWAGQLEDRRQAMLRLQQIADTVKDETNLRIASESLASYHYENSEYETSVGYYLTSLELAKKKEVKKKSDSTNIGISLSTVAEIYSKMGQNQKSLDYYREAAIYIVNCKEAAGSMYNNFIALFLDMDQLDSANHYYSLLKSFASDYDNSEDIVFANISFAGYYVRQNDLAKARTYADEASALMKNIDDDFGKGQVNAMQGLIRIKAKDWQAAIPFLEAAAVIQNQQSRENARDMELMLSQAYGGAGNWEKAYLHSKTYAALADTLARDAIKRNLSEMEAKYQNNDKQQHIELLDKDNRLKQTMIDASRRQRFLLIGGILLLMGLAATLAVYYRNKRKTADLLAQKNKELDSANQTKARLFSIISHDLRTPVSQLFQFLQLQQINPNLLNQEQLEVHNKRISGGVTALLETMEDILVWSKTQMDGFEPSHDRVAAEPLVRDIFNLLNPLSTARNVALAYTENSPVSPATDSNMLKVILRNLVQNALQHAPPGSSVIVTAGQNEGMARISVLNEGKELSAEVRSVLEGKMRAINSSSNGLGLQLVREFCDRLNIKLATEIPATGGTVISLSIPAA